MISWHIDEELIDYQHALSFMENRVLDIQKKKEKSFIWFLEHPSVYTAGRRARKEDLISSSFAFPVYNTGRGGRYTYHGPGQLIIYLMIDLETYHLKDIKLFIKKVESWCQLTLKEFGVEAFPDIKSEGLWIQQKNLEKKKLVFYGFRISRWVTYHGLALNITTDLTPYKAILPCGLDFNQVTSLKEMGVQIKKGDLIHCFKKNITELLG